MPATGTKLPDKCLWQASRFHWFLGLVPLSLRLSPFFSVFDLSLSGDRLVRLVRGPTLELPRPHTTLC